MKHLTGKLRDIVGEKHVLLEEDMLRYAIDMTSIYSAMPGAVVRPASTAEVAAIMALAHETGTPVVPLGGNTGLVGGGSADGALVLSLERLNRIREIRPEAGIAIAEAGVILSKLHDAAAEHGLAFPVVFGAREAAMIGGILSTNAGGSNVLRYGNTRAQCLGLEVVLPDGEILNLMTELYKDNSGYDLRDLFIGAEGTLGVITAAVLRLCDRPTAFATGTLALTDLPGALKLLNALQTETGGLVEAFEYMPGSYIRQHLEAFPGAREPFDTRHEVNILVEIASTRPSDTTPRADGSVPLASLFEETLGRFMEEGHILDAVIAQNEAQRREMWDRREAAADIGISRGEMMVNTDVSLPLDKIAEFLERMAAHVAEMDPGAEENIVSHLGDGNVHYGVWTKSDDPALPDQIVEKVEDVVAELGGSFSAEHGVGLSKMATMARRKDPVALRVMRQVKAALDPKGIMNPGKVLPDEG